MRFGLASPPLTSGIAVLREKAGAVLKGGNRARLDHAVGVLNLPEILSAGKQSSGAEGQHLSMPRGTEQS